MAQNLISFHSHFQLDPLIKKIGWAKRLQLGDSAERLGISLEVYYKELKQLEFKALNFQENIPDETYESIANQFEGMAKLLEKSAESLDNGNLELGWEAFNATQRLETQACYELQQIRGSLQDFWRGKFEGRAISVYTEGNDKLKGWRKTMINSLLGEESQDKLQRKKKPRLSEVIQAQQVLSEHHSNVYRRLTILNSQIGFLEITGILAILIWVSLLIFEPNLDKFSSSVFSPYLTISSLIFGILGACISGIMRMEKRSTKQRIPDQLASFVYTVARPLVGAVSALGVVVFVLAGILDIGSQTPGLYLAVAFAAGFSERLLELGIGKIEQPKNDTQ
jgi:exonuclease VII small subunit